MSALISRSPEVLSRCSIAAHRLAAWLGNVAVTPFFIASVIIEQQLRYEISINLYAYSSAMQAYVYRARVATTQSQDKVPHIAARGEAGVVSGHSPLCRASVGIVKPPTEPPRAAMRSQAGMP